MLSYTYISALIGNVVCLVAGTALTWSSPMLEKLNSTDTTPLSHIATDEERSWISSLLSLGAVFGPFIFGFAADKVGRKWALISLGVPFAVAHCTLAFAQIVELFYASRFIIGTAIGGVFTVVPMYMGEIADDSNRGALGSIMNCFITAGLLLSFCIGPYLPIIAYNLILGILPVVFMVLFFFFAPETPHFFISKGNMSQAENSLNKLRGAENKNNTKELEEIKTIIESTGKASFLDIFKSKGLIKAFIISLALVGFQQLSGINAVLFYATTIFQASGSSIPADACSIIIGGVQFGTSFVTPLIVDRLGRKLLLSISGIGMFISQVPLGLYFFLQDDGRNVDAISWLPVVSLVLYIITYNFGFGPLPWAIMGELFPSNVKSIASAFTSAFCWLLSFLITKYFESLVKEINMGPSFWLFSGFSILAFLFTYFVVIETKGKNVQEIQDILGS